MFPSRSDLEKKEEKKFLLNLDSDDKKGFKGTGKGGGAVPLPPILVKLP
jgi:hypothetical protein